MLELFANTIVLFLLIYACLDICYKFAGYLLSRLARPKCRRTYAVVFSDNNTDELEGILRSMARFHTDVCVVDIDTTSEGRVILDRLSQELGYVHVVSRREFFTTLPYEADQGFTECVPGRADADISAEEK